MFKTLMIGAAALALSAGAASAGVVIDGTPPFPPNPEENVLLNTNVQGLQVWGTTNQTNTTVTFTGQETLFAPANGQARITTPAPDAGLNWLEISLGGGLNFTEIEFNLDAVSNGFVSFFFYDQNNALVTNDGPQFNPFTLNGSGQNFFTSYATGDTLFSKVRLQSTVDLSDVSQIRLGGITSAVPEPATWAMMIVGFGLAGAGLRASRRKTLAVTA